MQFHEEELGDLVNWNNLNNMTFHIIKYMVMHVQNMCFNLWKVCCELTTRFSSENGDNRYCTEAFPLEKVEHDTGFSSEE